MVHVTRSILFNTVVFLLVEDLAGEKLSKTTSTQYCKHQVLPGDGSTLQGSFCM